MVLVLRPRNVQVVLHVPIDGNITADMISATCVPIDENVEEEPRNEEEEDEEQEQEEEE